MTVQERLEVAISKAQRAEQQLCWLREWCVTTTGIDTNRKIGSPGWPYSVSECIAQAVELNIREVKEENHKLRQALRWCGGSTDFSPGGQAHEGWVKIVAPLLDK